MQAKKQGARNNPRHAWLSLYLLDASAWILAAFGAIVLRFEFNLTQVHFLNFTIFVILTLLLQLMFGWAFAIYRGRFQIGSLDEAQAIAFSVSAVAGIVFSLGSSSTRSLQSHVAQF